MPAGGHRSVMPTARQGRAELEASPSLASLGQAVMAPGGSDLEN